MSTVIAGLAVCGLLAACGLIVLGAWYALPHVIRKAHISNLRRTVADRRVLALTYDDGPGARLTPRLLAELAALNARATFFALGRRAREHPEILDRVRREGHEIGCHTEDHGHAWRCGPLATVRDMLSGCVSLQRWLRGDALFRPPYGKVNLATWIALWYRRARPAFWTIDSTDTWPQLTPIEEVVARVVADGGGVVLMHDHDRAADWDRRAVYVRELTRALVQAARREGLRVCTMTEVLRGEAVAKEAAALPGR